MTARSVQISLDPALLARIDRHSLSRRHGRSAFIRAAIEAYLAAERRRLDDEAYKRGYARTERLESELAPLMEGQAWPKE